MISDAFPLDPPTDWFTTLPDWFEPGMKATVITDGPDAGRFAGTVAQRGTFILNGGSPWSAPDSPSGYKDSMQGDTVCADGSTVRTANLSADLNHISPRASFGQAAVDTTAATNSSPYGFATAAQADGIVTLLNEIRAVVVEKGIMKGSA